MPQAVAQRPWLLYVVALLYVGVAAVAVRGAVGWYDHPIAGVLVDPDLVVSSIGLPTWDGVRQGLRFPDEIVMVDGEDLVHVANDYRARAWDEAIDRAARGATHVHVRVDRAGTTREVDLAIEPLSPLAWWLNAGAILLIGALYALAALTAYVASPEGKLARTFAKTALFAALFLLTFFDFHTSRNLVPAFQLAFAMVSMGFLALALRLPDDAPLIARHPWVIGAMDALGLIVGIAMLARHLRGQSTTALQQVCTVLFGSSQFLFVVIVLVRFARATGSRRETLRSLLGALIIAHVPVAVFILLAMISSRGSTIAFCLLPVLALSPLSTFAAFVRHDIWKSRAFLSRMLTRAAIAGVACALSIAIGGAFAASLGVPFHFAMIAAGGGGLAAAVLVSVALSASDRGLFPSRARYKPTIEQLSEELTEITAPAQLATAVERTVRRWLDCDKVEFVSHSAGDGEVTRGALLLDGAPAAPNGDEDLTLPVTFGGRALGTLRVGQKRGGALFTSDDVDLLRTIANQAALALAHAHSYAELEEVRKQQVAAWRDERAALVETVAAEIAHEVRYPINFFRSIFRRGTTGGKLDAEEVEIGCEEVDRLERLVAGLRRVAQHKLERRSIDLSEVATRAEIILRDALGERHLDVSLSSGLALRCNPDQVTQMLVNLVSNALDATPRGERVGISWASTPKGGELTVWDEGAGFEGEASQLFAPWFTTKPRGTGLGLAITHRLVRAHGWSIDVVRHEQTTRFVIAVSASDIVEAAHVRREAP